MLEKPNLDLPLFVRKNFGLWPLRVFWGMVVTFARQDLAWGKVFFTVIPCFLPGVKAYVLYQRTRPRISAWQFPVKLAPLARASHEIAKYAYGTYLSHPFAIVLGFYLLRRHALWIELGATLVAIAVVSYSAYHLVEKSMILPGAGLAAKAERQYEQKHLDALEGRR